MNIETECRLVRRPEDFNVETVIPRSLLPHRQKCAIRFEADTTVTILLGMAQEAHRFSLGELGVVDMWRSRSHQSLRIPLGRNENRKPHD
jgi:hypothetical protein